MHYDSRLLGQTTACLSPWRYRQSAASVPFAQASPQRSALSPAWIALDTVHPLTVELLTKSEANVAPGERSAGAERDDSSRGEFFAAGGPSQPCNEVCGSRRNVVAMPERKVRGEGKLFGKRSRKSVAAGLHNLARLRYSEIRSGSYNEPHGFDAVIGECDFLEDIVLNAQRFDHFHEVSPHGRAAEVAARDLLARFPDQPDGWDRLGMVYEARGEKQKAAEAR